MTIFPRVICTELLSPKAYALLCEQDKNHTELPKEKRLSSLKHSTVITGQRGTGERLIAFGISVAE